METTVEFVGNCLAASSLILMAAIAIGSWLVRNQKDIKEDKK